MKIKRIVEGLVSGGWLAGMCLACGLGGRLTRKSIIGARPPRNAGRR